MPRRSSQGESSRRFAPAGAGVHVRGTSIDCDVARAGQTCFVSRADIVLGRGRPERFVATAFTAALRAQLEVPLEDPLLPRFGRPFALGKLRLELLPSGREEGAAQLYLEVPEGARAWRGLYAGSVWPGAVVAAESAQVRACDELVIDAPEVGTVDDDQAILRAFASGPCRVDDLAVVAELRRRFGTRVRTGGSWKGLEAGRSRGDLKVDPRRGTPLVAGRRTTDGVLALGLGPQLDAWLAFVRSTGCNKIWLRSRVGQPVDEAVAALERLGIETLRMGPPVQLSLFASPRIKVAR